MSKEKQIEEVSCKRCVHYDVCMYVNAKAVEFARAENCKLFKDNEDYRKASEVAREIFEEIGKILRKYDEIAERDKSEYGELIVGDIGCAIAELKKKYTEENNNDSRTN